MKKAITYEKIISIEPIKLESLRYDITIKDNHNFYANNMLVHNCQNLENEILENQGQLFEVTIKLDGSSMTVYSDNKHLGVCSRNLELKETEDNILWKVARHQKILEGLQFFGKNYAIQGEIIGEGIQDNREQIIGHDFYVFDIFNIDEYKYLSPEERLNFIKQMQDANYLIKSVPFLNQNMPFIKLDGNVESLLGLASGSSMNPNVLREGIVWKRIDGQFSFKIISNEYLLEIEKKMDKKSKK